MAKLLFEARYTPEGAKGVVREGGSGRRAASSRSARWNDWLTTGIPFEQLEQTVYIAKNP